jgi:hypothetical protein
VTRYTTWAAATLLAALLGAAGCSGADSEEGGAVEESETAETTGPETTGAEPRDGEPTKEEVAAVLGEGATGVSDADGMCLGLAIVDAVGLDRLLDADVFADPEATADASLADLGITLDEAQTAALLDGLHRCGDLRGMFREALAAGGSTPPEVASCMVEGLDGTMFDRLVVLSITGGQAALEADPELTGALQDSVVTCMAAG